MHWQVRSDGYRYGFNGMEKDDNIKGEGNSYTTEFRQYDPRVGRWLSIDPLAAEMPSWSSYNYTFNNPLFYTDPDGRQLIKPFAGTVDRKSTRLNSSHVRISYAVFCLKKKTKKKKT